MEAAAVCAILQAAEHLENVLVRYADGYTLTAQGTTLLNRCYREMRRTIEVYIPEGEHSLTYAAPAPGVPFKKTEGK